MSDSWQSAGLNAATQRDSLAVLTTCSGASAVLVASSFPHSRSNRRSAALGKVAVASLAAVAALVAGAAVGRVALPTFVSGSQPAGNARANSRLAKDASSSSERLVSRAASEQCDCERESSALCCSRRGLASGAALTLLAADVAHAEEPSASSSRIVRPRTGEPLFSFEVPRGSGLKETAFDYGDSNEKKMDEIAKYKRSDGVSIVVGPAPAQDFIRKQREGALPARLKALNYKIGPLQDDLECKVKYFEEDMFTQSTTHRWFRLLRSRDANATDAAGPLKSAIFIAECPESNITLARPAIEEALKSFRLGP